MNSTEKQEQQDSGTAFSIKDCALIAIATGRRATTVRELIAILTGIGLGSIYYHFWGGLLQPRFEEREYNNDFAAWAWYSLHDAPLAERLAVVDPTEFADLEDLRQELVEILEERLDEQEYLAYSHAGTRFEFMRSQIVVFDTRKQAESPRELAELVPKLSTGSIFYHFIDARRRLDSRSDDFSFWLQGYGEPCRALCARLTAVDPYFSSLSSIRKQLAEVFAEHCLNPHAS